MAAGQNPPIDGSFIDDKQELIHQRLVAAIENLEYLKSHQPVPFYAYKRAKDEVKYFKELHKNERNKKYTTKIK